jgi:carbamoyl-phosphate synthase large subunit
MKTTWLVGRLSDRFFSQLVLIAFRNAVDFGLPLLNNAKTAQLFVESLAKKIPQGGLRRYTEGHIPSEVRSWREFVGKRA